MTYYQFIRAVEGKVKEGVKENITVQLYTAVKNNGIKKYGLTIMEKGINISPTIYLEEYYQQFCDGDNIEEIAEERSDIKVGKINVDEQPELADRLRKDMI